MDPSIRQAIARIDIVQVGTTASRGTGFLVAPDLVLTAFHVVADRSATGVTRYPGRIALTFPTHTTDATVVEDRADPRADWILLRCQTPPADVRPIPLADRVEDGVSWETYGFPDANPRDGMVQIGSVANAGGTFEGVSAYQLFSREAAAGTGAPVKGLSGGPVLVEGAIVGLLRSSLMRDGQNVAGTLYGCPIEGILERCGDLLPIPDPVWGLAGLPHRPLPATPFRFLERFTAQDAEIFFGRTREIRALYNRVTARDGPGVILLYGQSGAGKSSFLDAGLLPRLEASYTTVYVRRDRATGLLATLRSAVTAAAPVAAAAVKVTSLHPSEALRFAWIGAETATGRPLVIVLDQVEEVFTLPSDDPDELATLIDALSPLWQPGSAPHGRVILGFRKEWFAEIQKLLDGRGVEYTKVFLDALDHDAVTEIVTGLQRTNRLRDRYRLDVEVGLADAIARDLTADRNSPVAPMLQVLLSRLWRDASTTSASRPHFTLALYEGLRDEGYQLTDFLDQQLAALARTALSAGGAVADVVDSGLALDILRFHVSELGTARSRTLEEVRSEYERDADVEWVVRELKGRYLLSDLASESQTDTTVTRLAHDTLAPAVRARFDESDRPGQRARRIIENRASEWIGGRDGVSLDARDLALAERGLVGMRAVRPDEQRLLHASRIARDRNDRLRRLLWKIAAGGVVALAASLVWALISQRETAQSKRETDQSFSVAELREAQDAAATGDTRTALGHLARALRLDVDNTPARAWAFDYLASVPRLQLELRHQREVMAAAFSPDGTRVVTASLDGTASVWDTHTGQLVGQPLRHEGPVFAAAFSPDGTRVVTASADGTARVWDGRTGRTVGAWLRHQSQVYSAVFSPDGSRVATASNDRTARVWDAHTGQPVGQPLQHDQPVTAATFSPDGTRVVTSSAGTARVWDARTGQEIGPPLQGEVNAAGFSPDGTRVVTASLKTARVWDVRTRQTVGVPLQHEGQVVMAAFSPDGTRVVTASDNTARVWDARTGQAVGAPLAHKDKVWVATFSPDGTRVVTASEDNTARVWDARTGQPVWPPLRHDGRVTAVTFSPDGALLVTASEDKTARVWVAHTGQPVGSLLENGGGVQKAAFNPDGTRVVAASWGNTARVWDTQTGNPVGPALQHEGRVTAAEFSPDGTRVVTASDKTARVYDVQTGQAVGPPLRHERFVNAVAFSPDGTRVVTASGDLTARVWDVQTGHPAGSPLRHEGAVNSVAFSPDGTRIVTASGDKTAQVWDAYKGQPVGPPLQHQRDVLGATFSPDGTLVLTASRDNAARVWDASTGQPDGPSLLHQGAVLAAAFSPDGTLVVTASEDKTAQVWDVRTEQPVGPPLPHQDFVFDAAFSPDGTRVVTASADRTARVWDARTGQSVGASLQHQGAVITAAFSPDGTRVMTGSNDGTVRLWDAQVGKRDDSVKLAELAEVLSGFRLSAIGALESLPDRNARFVALGQESSRAPAGKPGVASFIRWLFDDPWKRSASPLSQMTVAEYIDRMLALGDDGRAEAERVFLGHPRLQDPGP